MLYRDLGRTGFKVSEIGVGGEWLERLGVAETETMLRRCQEVGINILDCYMSNPEVRANIGQAIQGCRDKWYIEGHIGSIWENGQYKRSREMDKVRAAYEDLLRKMRTDYIDIGMIHYVDELSDWQNIVAGGVLEYALELKQRGVVRSLGVSSHNAMVARKIVESGYVDVVLFSINPAFEMISSDKDVIEVFYNDDNVVNHELMERVTPERVALYNACQEHRVGINVMKPFAGGLLLDEKQSPFGVALTPIQCLHYALTRPAVASVMVGFGKLEHIEAAIAYENATAEERDYTRVLAGAPRHAYEGQCTYCGHCAPCMAGIDIAMVNKLVDLAKAHDALPDTVRDHYECLSVKAGECLQCGACLQRCPFGVNIVQRMAEAKRVFGK